MNIPAFDWNDPAGLNPWWSEMADTPQDPRWHSEGDVATHTAMVLAEASKHPALGELTDDERNLLGWAILFHDCGKPETTKHYDDRGIISPGHARLGAAKARRHFWELGCDLETQAAVSRLIAFHGIPPRFLERVPECTVVRLSQNVSIRLLSVLAECDMLGRVGQDGNEQADRVSEAALMRQTAKEYGCETTSFPFDNDFSRFSFARTLARGELAPIPYSRFDSSASRVEMLCGIPGSGKSTWSRGLELPVLALDDVRSDLDIEPDEEQGRVIQEATARAKRFLATRTNFIFDATNVSQLTRRRWVNLFVEYGAAVNLRFFSGDPKTTLKRNAARPDATRVPGVVIDKLASKVDLPFRDDAWGVSFHDT